MDGETRDLANRLFAVATAKLEDATILAAEGQSPRLGPARLAEIGRHLQAAARAIAVLAEAATIVASPDAERHRPGSKSRP